MTGMNGAMIWCCNMLIICIIYFKIIYNLFLDNSLFSVLFSIFTSC